MSEPTTSASPAITIRPLEPADLEEVASIHVAAFEDQGEGALARAVTSLREELARAWAVVHVAWRAEKRVGASVAWVVADEVHVLDVATHPAHRRQGVGRALVNDLLRLARERQARHLYLEVRRSNVAALELYRGAGFTAVGVRARYYSDDEDAIEMALEMAP